MSLRTALLDLLWPRNCVLTGAPLPANTRFRYLSETAFAQLQRALAPCCHTCGAPFHGELAGPRHCPHCRELEPLFSEGRTLLVLREKERLLLHTLKYHGGLWLLPDIATLATTVPGYLDALAGRTLVPVPLHPVKQRTRGYNQSLLLARALARLAPGADVQQLLIRTRDTPSQTRLDREARRDNMDAAFALAPRALLRPQRAHVVIDDVFTTGATLNACCAALRQGGLTRLTIATLGHG